MRDGPVSMDTDRGESPRTKAPRSPGGHVVEDCLASVGFGCDDPSVALVETSTPKRRPFEVVLCQNAWNFIPREQFSTLMEPYPRQSRLLYRARRAVAQMNVRRARRVVVLSMYMRDLLARIGVPATVAQVGCPVDLGEMRPERPRWLEDDADFWLVPGTLTWYKDPHYALRLAEMAREEGREPPLLIFAGGDDGSGCRRTVEAYMRRAALSGRVGEVTRPEMLWLLRNALVTVIPSRLESLSLSFSEAMCFSPRVWARPLPVHLESAQGLERKATWLSDVPDLALLATLSAAEPPPTTDSAARDQCAAAWLAVRRAMEAGRS